MEHFLNDHEDHANKHENSHKLCDDYSRAECLYFLVGQDIFSQVYFEEVTLCFTLINMLKVLRLFERVALVI